MSLGTKTTALIAATFFAVLLTASLVLLHYEGESLKHSIFEGLDGQAKIASQGIASFLDDGLRASNAIATTLPIDALSKGRLGEVESYLKQMSAVFPAFQNGIFILDRDGKLLVDYPSHPEVRGESFAFREYYQRTLQEQKGIVSRPYKSKHTGKPALAFTAPVHDASGRFIAIVGCSVDLLSQEALGGYAKQKFGKTGYLYVFDKSRQLVLHPDPKREMTYVEAGKNQVLEDALQGFEGAGESINSVGVPMLLAVRPIPHTDWFVGVQIPQIEAYAPVAQSRARIILVSSLAMLGAVLLGGVTIRRVSRPLQQLEQVASRISADLEDAETKGTYHPSLDALDRLKNIRSRDEVGLLASSIVQLGTRLNLTLSSLQQSEEQYRTLFEENSIGICNSAEDGRYLSINPAFARIFGYNSPEEMLALAPNVKPFYVDPSCYREIGRQLREQGKCEDSEFQIYRKDGNKIWIRSSVRAVRNANGGLLYYVGSAEDITAHKLLEEQFRQAQKMEAIGSLAGGVAHDLNNLLMVISSYAELLMERVGDEPELTRMIGEILKAQQRGASLTQQLLAFSRRQVLRPTILNLNRVLDDIAKMLHRLIGEDIELVVSYGSDLGSVKIDAGQLQQVLMNLAINARDAMPNGGNLRIEAANVELDEEYCQSHAQMKLGSYVMLAVSDTGAGMNKETQWHIFDPFFTTKEVGKGTGLGLSIVYGVVKQSGGYIWVDSEPGQGTAFNIYLPRVEKAAQVLSDEVPSRTSLCGLETILLVEDNDQLREAVHEFLETEGYELLTARTPADAIEISSRHAGPIQLLLTDLIMPGMTGTKLAECLRSRYANLQVLYMSGYTDDAIVRNGGLEADASFLQKPFALNSLASMLRELLDRRIH